MNLRLSALAGAVVLAGALAAGCSSSDGTSAPETTSVSRTTATTSSSAAPTSSSPAHTTEPAAGDGDAGSAGVTVDPATPAADPAGADDLVTPAQVTPEVGQYQEADPVIGYTQAPGMEEPHVLDKEISGCGDPSIHQTGTTFFTDGTSGWTSTCAAQMG